MLSGKATFSGTETLAITACCSCLSSAIASLFLPWGFNGFGSSTIERDAVLIALEGSEAFELWLWGIFCCKTCVSTWLVNSGAGLCSMLGPRVWKTTLHPNLTSVFHHAARLTGHSNGEASLWNSQSLVQILYCQRILRIFHHFFKFSQTAGTHRWWVMQWINCLTFHPKRNCPCVSYVSALWHQNLNWRWFLSFQ